MADDIAGGSWQDPSQGGQTPLSPEEAEQQLLRNLAALGGEESPRRRRQRRERAPEEPTYPKGEEPGGESYEPSYAYAAPAYDSSRPRGRRPGRVGRIIVRFVAPLVFLGAVIAIVSIVMNSGVMNGGDGAVVSPSPSKSAHASPGTSVSVRIYKVRSGDTLSVIAERTSTTVDAILELNPGLNANALTVGAKIKLPAKP